MSRSAANLNGYAADLLVKIILVWMVSLQIFNQSAYLWINFIYCARYPYLFLKKPCMHSPQPCKADHLGGLHILKWPYQPCTNTLHIQGMCKSCTSIWVFQISLIVFEIFKRCQLESTCKTVALNVFSNPISPLFHDPEQGLHSGDTFAFSKSPTLKLWMSYRENLTKAITTVEGDLEDVVKP